MARPGSRLSRTVRAGVFTVGALALAVMAHVGSGGGRPGLSVLTAAAAVVLVAAFAATGRERSLTAITTATVVVQAGLHVAFMASAQATSAAGTGPMAGMAERAGAGMTGMAGIVRLHGAAGPLAAPGHGGAALAGLAVGASGRMLLAHLAAALVLSCCLRRAEAATWALARAAGRLVLRGLVLPRPLAAPRPHRGVPAWAGPRVRPLPSELLHSCVVERGPPQLPSAG